MAIEYIVTGENLSSIMLLLLTSFNVQFVHSVERAVVKGVYGWFRYSSQLGLSLY